MKIHKVLAVSVLLLMSHSISADQLSYAEAKDLLIYNCAECYGASKAGLEKGIKTMEALLENKMDVPLDGRLLLADSYNQLGSVHYESGSAESVRLVNLRDNLYTSLGKEVLAEIKVDSTIDAEQKRIYIEILKGYISTVDNDSRLAVTETMLRLDPSDSDARFSYGRVLLSMGREKDGITQMEKALSESRFTLALYQGVDLISYYVERKKYNDAERIISVLETKNLGVDISSFRSMYLPNYKQGADGSSKQDPDRESVK